MSVLVAMQLMSNINSSAQSDFTVASPSTDSYGGLIKPMKSGNSIQIQIKMTNNKNITYTASINKNAMFPWDSWVQIDNNSQTLAPNKTITFLLTITPPVGTLDDKYTLFLNFNAYDSNNNNNPYTWSTLKVLVDNTPPVAPTVSVSSRTSSAISIGFSSTDSRSTEYTNANQSSGINGIKSYTLVLKNPDGTTKESKSVNATDASTYTFSALNANTTYTTFVTAADLASNSSTSTGLFATTAPAALANLTNTSTNYCNTTLAWSGSAGATRYNIYNYSVNPIVTYTTTATSYTVEGLLSGKAYDFYVSAVSNAGESPRSKIAVTTLSVPTPSISGPVVVCSSGATFTAVNLPTGCSISWDRFPNLSQSSSSGNYATFASVGNGTSWVKATFDSGCGSTSKYYGVTAGSPVPGSIAIEFDAPPGRFTASIDGMATANTYKWYLDGVLKYTTPNTSVIFQRQLNNCGHVYYVDVVEENACGVSGISHGEVAEDPCYYGFTISPNPASDNITLTIGSTDNGSSRGNGSTGTTALASKYISTKAYTIRILDSFGALKAMVNKSGESVTLPVGNLNNGVYVVEITDGKNVYRQQLVVKH